MARATPRNLGRVYSSSIFGICSRLSRSSASAPKSDVERGGDRFLVGIELGADATRSDANLGRFTDWI